MIKIKDFRSGDCYIPFMFIDSDLKTNYLKCIHRVTTSFMTEYEFVFILEDDINFMEIIEKRFCNGEQRFYEVNTIVPPLSFKSVVDVCDFVNLFLGKKSKNV